MDPLFEQFLRDLQELVSKYSAMAVIFPPKVKPRVNEHLERLVSSKRLAIIAEHVAKHFGLPLSTLVCVGPREKVSNLHSEIRFMGYRLSKRFTKCSTTAIGAYYNRNHTTITVGIRRCKALCSHDREYAAAYNLIESNLAEIFREPKPEMEKAAA